MLGFSREFLRDQGLVPQLLSSLAGAFLKPFFYQRRRSIVGVFTPFVVAILLNIATVASASSLDGIKLSSEHGRITDSYENQPSDPSQKIVIHVQDAHASLEGQKQIKRIIEQLIEKEDITLVGVEGAMGTFPEYRELQKFPVKQARQKVTNYYLKEGFLSGAEQAAITSEIPFQLVGLEEKRIFEESFSLFTELKSHKDEITTLDNGLRKVISKLKRKIFKGILAKVDRTVFLFEQGDLTLLRLARELEAYRPTLNFRSVDYPNLAKLARPADEIGRDEPEEFRTTEAVEKLGEEIERLKVMLQDELAREPEEKEMVRLTRDTSAVLKMLYLEAAREDVRYLLSLDGASSLVSIFDKLYLLSKKYGVSFSEYSKAKLYENWFRKAQQFYKLVYARDRIFVERLLSEMERGGVEKAILVSGGFHSEGVTQVFKEKNVSYVVITPYLKEGKLDYPFAGRMTGKLFPISQSGTSYFVALAPALMDERVRRLHMRRMYTDMYFMATLVLGEEEKLLRAAWIDHDELAVIQGVQRKMAEDPSLAKGLKLSETNPGYLIRRLRSEIAPLYDDERTNVVLQSVVEDGLEKAARETLYGEGIPKRDASEVIKLLKGMPAVELASGRETTGFGVEIDLDAIEEIERRAENQPETLTQSHVNQVLPYLFQSNDGIVIYAADAVSAIGKSRPDLMKTPANLNTILSGVKIPGLPRRSYDAALFVLYHFDPDQYVSEDNFERLWPAFMNLTRVGFQSRVFGEKLLTEDEFFDIANAFADRLGHTFSDEKFKQMLLFFKAKDSGWHSTVEARQRALYFIHTFKDVNPRVFSSDNLQYLLSMLGTPDPNIRDSILEVVRVFNETRQEHSITNPFDEASWQSVYEGFKTPTSERVVTGKKKAITKRVRALLERASQTHRKPPADHLIRESYLRVGSLFAKANSSHSAMKYLSSVAAVLNEEIEYTEGREEKNWHMRRAAFRVVKEIVAERPELRRDEEFKGAISRFAEKFASISFNELVDVHVPSSKGVKPGQELLFRVNLKAGVIEDSDEERVAGLALPAFIVSRDLKTGPEGYVSLPLEDEARRGPLDLPGLVVRQTDRSAVQQLEPQPLTDLFFAIPLTEVLASEERLSKFGALLKHLIVARYVSVWADRITSVRGEVPFRFSDVTGDERHDTLVAADHEFTEKFVEIVNRYDEYRTTLATDLQEEARSSRVDYVPRLLHKAWLDSLQQTRMGGLLGQRVRWIQHQGRGIVVMENLMARGLRAVDVFSYFASYRVGGEAHEAAWDFFEKVKDLADGHSIKIGAVLNRDTQSMRDKGFGVAAVKATEEREERTVLEKRSGFHTELDRMVQEIDNAARRVAGFVRIPFNPKFRPGQIRRLPSFESKSDSFNVTVTMPAAILLNAPLERLFPVGSPWSLARVLADPHHKMILGVASPEEVERVKEHIGYDHPDFPKEAHLRIAFVPVEEIDEEFVLVSRRIGMRAERLRFPVLDGAYLKHMAITHFLFSVGRLWEQAVNPDLFQLNGDTFRVNQKLFKELSGNIQGALELLKSA